MMRPLGLLGALQTTLSAVWFITNITGRGKPCGAEIILWNIHVHVYILYVSIDQITIA